MSKDKNKENIENDESCKNANVEADDQQANSSECELENDDTVCDKSEAESEEDILLKKVNELNDKYLRLSAEYDNYRKRTLKEKMELQKSAGEAVLLNVLPVVDDFDRALAHLSSASDLDAVKEGIDIIYTKLKDFLNQHGVKEIDTVEKDFDTDLHEAITEIPAPSEDLKGKVIDCTEKGYMLNDKVMRYSKVVVGK